MNDINAWRKLCLNWLGMFRLKELTTTGYAVGYYMGPLGIWYVQLREPFYHWQELDTIILKAFGERGQT